MTVTLLCYTQSTQKIAGYVGGGNKYLLECKMTEHKDQQRSVASWNKCVIPEASRVIAVPVMESRTHPTPPPPCHGSLWPYRSCSLKWELTIPSAFLFSRKWKWGHEYSYWLSFQHFPVLVSGPQPRENRYIFHLEIHQNSSRSNSKGRSLAHLFAFILVLTTLLGAKLFPLVSTSSFPIGSNMKSLVCQCNNFLLIIKEESWQLESLKRSICLIQETDFPVTWTKYNSQLWSDSQISKCPLFLLSGQSRQTWFFPSFFKLLQPHWSKESESLENQWSSPSPETP